MNIVGMTTTAAAKNALLIQKLKCKIVIAEEAAEVQERFYKKYLTGCTTLWNIKFFK